MSTPEKSGIEIVKINTQISLETAEFIASGANAMNKLILLKPMFEGMQKVLESIDGDNNFAKGDIFDHLYGNISSRDRFYDDLTTSNARDAIKNILIHLDPEHDSCKIANTTGWGDTDPSPITYYRSPDDIDSGSRIVYKEVDIMPLNEGQEASHPELLGRWVMRVGEIFPDTQHFVVLGQERVNKTPRSRHRTDDASEITFSALVSYSDDRPREGIAVIDHDDDMEDTFESHCYLMESVASREIVLK